MKRALQIILISFEIFLETQDKFENHKKNKFEEKRNQSNNPENKE